jgi:hypothetical protein
LRDCGKYSWTWKHTTVITLIITSPTFWIQW